jgi:hypothetical protein
LLNIDLVRPLLETKVRKIEITEGDTKVPPPKFKTIGAA